MLGREGFKSSNWDKVTVSNVKAEAQAKAQGFL